MKFITKVLTVYTIGITLFGPSISFATSVASAEDIKVLSQRLAPGEYKGRIRKSSKELCTVVVSATNDLNHASYSLKIRPSLIDPRDTEKVEADFLIHEGGRVTGITESGAFASPSFDDTQVITFNKVDGGFLLELHHFLNKSRAKGLCYIERPYSN